jgi:hypothetical protein
MDIIIKQELLISLIKEYFPEATETQVITLTEELLREIPVMVHAKTRELVKVERNKRV